jgi:hypothetical protein
LPTCGNPMIPVFMTICDLLIASHAMSETANGDTFITVSACRGSERVGWPSWTPFEPRALSSAQFGQGTVEPKPVSQDTLGRRLARALPPFRDWPRLPLTTWRRDQA